MVKARLRGLLGWPQADAAATKGTLAPARQKQARPNPYQAVAIVCTGNCCAAVKSLAGQRFLARSAPTLPLQNCTLADECRCSFKKYDDRRDSERRVPGERSKWYGGAEKRGARGRRQTD